MKPGAFDKSGVYTMEVSYSARFAIALGELTELFYVQTEKHRNWCLNSNFTKIKGTISVRV